jgi:hypothetical protein
MMASTLRFRARLFGIKSGLDRNRNAAQSPSDTPLSGPPEPLDGEDSSLWPISYRRWSVAEMPGGLKQEAYSTEMGSFGFGDKPPLESGMFLRKIDPCSGDERLYRVTSSPENSSGAGNRWYVNATAEE